jgi:hypothetical protein
MGWVWVYARMAVQLMDSVRYEQWRQKRARSPVSYTIIKESLTVIIAFEFCDSVAELASMLDIVLSPTTPKFIRKPYP